jgi:microsomal dipeptidase-like Zn-dependent dipeptidase
MSLLKSFTIAIACSIASLAMTTRAIADDPPTPRVIDLHVDLPFALHTHVHTIDDANAETSFDRLQRGRAGLLVLPLFIRAATRKTPSEVRDAYNETYQGLMAALSTPAAQRVITAPGVPEAEGKVATLLSFEGAEGFADNPNEIIPWIKRGACIVGLVHVRTNTLAGSSGDPKRDKRAVGITDKGRALIQVVYSNGALIDVAHASDAMLDALVPIAQTFNAPIVDTHTGVRALRNIDRNIDDARMRAIASTGGIIGIDIHAGHIGPPHGADAHLDDVVAHLEHAVQVAGITHVSIGSDLDGAIVQPRDADGAATWPILAKKLAAKGWKQDDIAAVFHDNAMRVLSIPLSRGCGSDGQKPQN